MFGHCLYFNLNKTTRLVNKMWDKAFAQVSLSPAHGYLLLAVGKSEHSQTTQELRDVLQLDLSTVSRFVDALEKKELIKRVPTSEDKRVKQIVFTQSGELIFKELEMIAKGLFTQVRSVIDEKEVEGMVEASKKMSEQLLSVNEL